MALTKLLCSQFSMLLGWIKKRLSAARERFKISVSLVVTCNLRKHALLARFNFFMKVYSGPHALAGPEIVALKLSDLP